MKRQLSRTVFTILILINGAVNAQHINFIAPELLGRPTDHSVTVNVVADTDIEVFFEYGHDAGALSRQTGIVHFPAGTPIEMILDGLQANTQYYYRMRYRIPAGNDFLYGDVNRFHTQRAAGESFIFAIQADSHLGTSKHCDPALYERTLSNIRSDSPDFLVDLGDTFRATKLDVVNYEHIAQLYLNQRSYFGLACRSVPLYFVIGNHEDEMAWHLDGTPDNVAVWAATARKMYIPNPVPDAFYSGNTISKPFVGLNEDYYAWEWGDALFVVLNYYGYTEVDPDVTGDNWTWTLGDKQYQWFQKALEQSSAAFKFVFCHHILGSGRRRPF